MSIECYILSMENSNQKITTPIFEIDAQEMNSLVDEFVRAKALDKDQEVKDYYERLKAVEEALSASKDNMRTLFDLHQKVGADNLLGFKPPVSLTFTKCGNGWRIYDREKDPVAFITEELHMYAICKKVASWHEAPARDIQFSADNLLSQITTYGLDEKVVFQYFAFDNGATYRKLIETMETMVRTLPLYVKAFKEYIQKKGK